MSLESATYIDGLVSTNPDATDGIDKGDDHIRLIKSVLKATFPNIDGPVTVDQNRLNNGAVPQGVIVIWNGSVASIPTGWALCDGTTGISKEDGSGTFDAPDMRDKFILGAGTGGTAAVDDTGGSGTTSSNGAHTHTGATGSGGSHNHGGTAGSTTLTTSQIPAHTHTANHEFKSISTSNGSLNVLITVAETSTDGTDSGFSTGSAGTGGSHNHTISTESAHTHTISSDGAHTHTLTPPYLAKAYIIRK